MASAVAPTLPPSLPLHTGPTSVEHLTRLREALGGGPTLLVKRDDAIGFAFGGNKVRKMAFVAADARAQRADTLITCGGVQSNHARVTAITAAKLGLRCILVVNGEQPARLSGNALLDHLAGADVRYVASRDQRDAAMTAAADEVRAASGRPYVIPLGASTPLGAAAFALAFDELRRQMPLPDVIVHATSSGGTQAGLVAGCRLAGATTRIIGVSADESSDVLTATISGLLRGLGDLLGVGSNRFHDAPIEVDDRFVGRGYGVPTPESQEAISLAARSDGLFLDPTYTSKAMAGLLARVRTREFQDSQTILFWHTGGQVALFA